MCRKLKYILQKPIPKIKQLAIQLTISQLFQKLKSRRINKQDINPIPSIISFNPACFWPKQTCHEEIVFFNSTLAS
jgi:hypothetical protein